jgi:hypothetical protein
MVSASCSVASWAIGCAGGEVAGQVEIVQVKFETLSWVGAGKLHREQNARVVVGFVERA